MTPGEYVFGVPLAALEFALEGVLLEEMRMKKDEEMRMKKDKEGTRQWQRCVDDMVDALRSTMLLWTEAMEHVVDEQDNFEREKLLEVVYKSPDKFNALWRDDAIAEVERLARPYAKWRDWFESHPIEVMPGGGQFTAQSPGLESLAGVGSSPLNALQELVWNTCNAVDALIEMGVEAGEKTASELNELIAGGAPQDGQD